MHSLVFIATTVLAMAGTFVIAYMIGYDAGIRYTYAAANVNTRRLIDHLREATKWLNGCLVHLTGPTRDRIAAFLERADVTLEVAQPPTYITEENREP